MEDWQNRVAEERKELGERIMKIVAFLSKGAPGASDEDRSLLRRQHSAMLDYADSLDKRILRFVEMPDAARPMADGTRVPTPRERAEALWIKLNGPAWESYAQKIAHIRTAIEADRRAMLASEVNAAIVRAVNCHGELVAALRALADEHSHKLTHALACARAVLATVDTDA